MRKCKNTNDKYLDLPCSVSRIQRSKMYVKLGWLDIHFLDHEVIVEIDSANRIPAFNLFEEKDDVEQRYNNFRIIDLIREEFISLGTDYTLIMRMTFKAYNFVTSGVMKKSASNFLLFASTIPHQKQFESMYVQQQFQFHLAALLRRADYMREHKLLRDSQLP